MKMFAALLVGSVVLWGLAHAGEPAAKSSKSADLAGKVFEHFNKHDWEAMAALYAEPAEFLDPSFGKSAVTKSRAETVAKYKELQGMFPDIKDDVQHVYASGENTVTVEFTSRGTAGDGTKFVLPICTVFTIEGGRITKDHTYFDN